MSNNSEPVELHLYDVSRGVASRLAPVLAGKEIAGLWHSGVVVGGIEYNYGPSTWRSFAGQSPYGEPDRIIKIGATELNYAQREDVIRSLVSSRFTSGSYDTLFNNGNHFANELLLLLTGSGLPIDILNQLQELVASPLGEQLLSLFVPSFHSSDAGGPTTPQPAAFASAHVDQPSSSAGPSATAAGSDDHPMDGQETKEESGSQQGEGSSDASDIQAATLSLLQDIMDNMMEPAGGFGWMQLGLGPAGGCGRGRFGLGPVGGCGRRFRGFRGCGPCHPGRGAGCRGGPQQCDEPASECAAPATGNDVKDGVSSPRQIPVTEGPSVPSHTPASGADNIAPEATTNTTAVASGTTSDVPNTATEAALDASRVAAELAELTVASQQPNTSQPSQE